VGADREELTRLVLEEKRTRYCVAELISITAHRAARSASAQMCQRRPQHRKSRQYPWKQQRREVEGSGR